MDRGDILPFHAFLWKIASRCNLDCTYCYVYHSSDQRWRLQPKLMSEEVARQTALRMREHLESHGKRDAVITFHGGEPLLGGVRHLEMLHSVIAEVLPSPEFDIRLTMQSNGLLFTEEIGDLLLSMGVTYGTSLDGPPEINDVYRVDHRGNACSDQLVPKLELIFSRRYRSLKPGILTVINPDVDAVEVSEYLFSFHPESVDFLFPLDNHDRLPKGKEKGYRFAAPYGEWLVAAFDYWWVRGKPVPVRAFNSILNMLCDAPSLVESLGLGEADMIVVETNGEIEAVDALKTTFDGATALGYDVFTHDFDTAATHLKVKRRQVGIDAVCQTCRECPLVEVCGGGYLPHRYSSRNGFDNPSVYCLDLEILINHIHAKLRSALRAEGGELLRTLVEPAQGASP